MRYLQLNTHFYIKFEACILESALILVFIKILFFITLLSNRNLLNIMDFFFGTIESRQSFCFLLVGEKGK